MNRLQSSLAAPSLPPALSDLCLSCLVCCSWVQSGPLQASSASSGPSPPSLCSKYRWQPHTRFLNSTVISLSSRCRESRRRLGSHLELSSTNTHTNTGASPWARLVAVITEASLWAHEAPRRDNSHLFYEIITPEYRSLDAGQQVMLAHLYFSICVCDLTSTLSECSHWVSECRGSLHLKGVSLSLSLSCSLSMEEENVLT